MPLALTAAEMGEWAAYRRVLSELGREPDHRIDLFANDVGRGLDELLRHLRGRGVHIMADSQLQTAVRGRKVTGVAVYTEALQLAEVADFLRRASNRYGPEFTGDSPFARYVLTAIAEADRAELRGVFGIDPLEPVPADDKTAADAGPKSKVSGAKGVPEALVTPLGGPRGRPSREARQFLERRSDQPTPKLRLFFAIQPA